MEEYIAEALSQGFIQPSISPATSSFFFVGKKDGGYIPASITVNSTLRSNNNHTRSLWSQPPSKSFVEIKSSQNWSAYNLVRIHVGDKWKTAFVTPTGHYEYRVMPYGLSISPSVFQPFMNEVPPSFLGYIITAEGVQMDQGKVSTIQEWPQPLTVKELQHFLGFSNFYRRFIKDYSSITAPLTSLLRGKPKALIWNPSAHEAFQQLKEIFSTAPLLRHPAPELPDASTTGVGAVLSQALSLAEQNYDVGNREVLAIKFSSVHPVEPEPIIPSNLIISPILWEQDNNIRHTTLQDPAPPEYPEGKIFVPRSQRLTLLGTAHQSPGSGHPCNQRTLSLLQTRYWWPSMRRDTIRYVQSCSVCAMSTSPCQLPTGKLVPLPIPQRPWSHIGVDFVTNLPV
ncbi:Transposon Tf2-11 polyprotein [Labeo rohita]|uniref:Gypsy retrotransposon integrase-like protein 1 n=1 Tax=Labeo rohita TaxID=84645 RepID=A0ABQ8MCI5_LABRO|nr:Transposon Tf2-11 polyprotein [Labeo rohita]